MKKYLCDDRDMTTDAVEEIVRRSDSLFESEGLGLWWLTGKEQGERIGLCGFTKDASLELLYIVHPAYVRKGFGHEAARAALRFAGNRVPGALITARIDEPNTPSIALARRLGFDEVGEERNPVTGGRMLRFERKL